jgi:hypothetical protein
MESASDRYDKLKARIEEEAEANGGEVPYWLDNDLLALETERDWESIRALCEPDDSRKKMDRIGE